MRHTLKSVERAIQRDGIPVCLRNLDLCKESICIISKAEQEVCNDFWAEFLE